MKKSLLVAVGIIIILGALAVFYKDKPGQTNNEPVKIGVLTPLSGPIAIAGEVQRNAITMALESLRLEGVDTSKYEIIYEDSKYDPKTALSGYEALKLKGVKLIIADGSPVVAVIRDKAEQDGILVFAQSATTPAFTDNSPFTCRLGLTADILGPSISAFASNSNVSRIAIFTPNNEYGTVMKDAITKSFKGTIVQVETYDQASGDLRSNILKLIQAQKDIEALVVINNITPEPMFKQLGELGWNKPIISDIWTITSPNLKDRKLVKDVKFVDYVYTPQVSLNTNKEAMKYAEDYQTTYGGSPILLGAMTYDSFNILTKAIGKAGTDPVKVSEYLIKMPTYSGITGDVKFDSSCQNTNTKLIWRKVLADGSFENI